MAMRIPDARLRIVERAGHNPHSEEPEVTVRAVASFLSASVSPARGHTEQDQAVSSPIRRPVVKSAAEVAPRAVELTTS
jgi:hypothetical protein